MPWIVKEIAPSKLFGYGFRITGTNTEITNPLDREFRWYVPDLANPLYTGATQKMQSIIDASRYGGSSH